MTPHLFHKYILGLADPKADIQYEIEQPLYLPTLKPSPEVSDVLCSSPCEFISIPTTVSIPSTLKEQLFAHLHCYDISKFQKIYGEYIGAICKYFSVIITYSKGSIHKIINEQIALLKIPNKGMDIGAKFCMVQYLRDQKIDYRYILFLHSKSKSKIRKKYFKPFMDIFEKEASAQEFIENIDDYDGYFPDIQWEIQGDRLKMVTGNPQFANSNLPERNLHYRNNLLDYLGCENQTNRFIEGNIYLLSKKIVERVFGDKKLYNILNRPTDFDYNWVCKRYRLSGSLNMVYNEFGTKRLLPRDKHSRDGYTEHVFERVILNCIDSDRTKIIKPPKICIIYVYYEKDNEQKNQTNLSFFIKYGLDKSRWRDMDITTLFIINGHQCEVLIPKHEDIYILKQDDCSDLAAYYNGIKYFEDKYKKSIYDFFTHVYLINVSSFGPVYEDGRDRHWLDLMNRDKKYNTVHNIDTNKDSDNMRALNRYANKNFGKFNKRFLESKLGYSDSIVNISNYMKYFNGKHTKYLIYAHYDKDNIIKNYVIESLVFFAKLGYNILFYTTSANINNYDKGSLPFKVNYYPNDKLKSGGMDWYMWYEGCRKLKQQNKYYEWIMLLNDSMIVGINGIDNMEESINTMENRGIDLWGHWDSNEVSYHIMSSLYEFKYKILEYFIKFTYTNLPRCKTKQDVILNCEIAWTRYIRSLGFKTSTVIPVKTLVCPYLYPSPTHRPININSWISNKVAFGIKWKYALPYLRSCNLSAELKQRLKYIIY